MKFDSFSTIELAQCTREEKRSTVALIMLSVQLSEKARNEGILSLYDNLIEIPMAFFRDQLSLVIDGCEGSTIEKTGWIQIYSYQLHGIDLLNALVAQEAALGIQAGSAPSQLLKVLIAYLGIDRDLFFEINQTLTEKYALPTETNVRFGFNEKIDAILARMVQKRKLMSWEIELLQTAKSFDGLLDSLPPEVLAIVLLYQTADQREAWFSKLSIKQKTQVLREINAMTSLDPEQFVKQVKKVLESMVLSLESESWPVGGFSIASELLNTLEPIENKLVCENLEKIDPDLAKKIKPVPFKFEDFDLLDDRSIQKVLDAVDTTELVIALSGASPVVREKMYKNMSTRSAKLIKDDIEFLGLNSIANASEAQQKIVNALFKLIEANEIYLPFFNKI